MLGHQVTGPRATPPSSNVSAERTYVALHKRIHLSTRLPRDWPPHLCIFDLEGALCTSSEEPRGLGPRPPRLSASATSTAPTTPPSRLPRWTPGPGGSLGTSHRDARPAILERERRLGTPGRRSCDLYPAYLT